MDDSDKSPNGIDDLSSREHRQLIGSVGLVLPFLLWLIAGWRPTGEHPWVPLSSISAYYYSGSVSVFAGMLVAMALFLFTYRGYDNAYYHRDRAAAIIAGLAAILIALFPTGAPDEALTLSWWTPRTGIIHLASAAVLFGSFIYFSLFLFPKTSVEKGQSLPLDKKVRNAVYIVCGIAISICIAWVIYAAFKGLPIFWPEALALEFFAISWLVKGRAYRTAAEACRKSAYYVSHPQQAVKKVADVMRAQPHIRQPQ
jgi:hypothetical protein